MKIGVMFHDFTSYVKKVAEEVQKIKFPARSEVVAMSIGVVVVTLLLGLTFYVIDILSILIINKGIMGL